MGCMPRPIDDRYLSIVFHLLDNVPALCGMVASLSLSLSLSLQRNDSVIVRGRRAVIKLYEACSREFFRIAFPRSTTSRRITAR